MGKAPAADGAPIGGTGPAVPPAGPDPIPPGGEGPSAPPAPDADGETVDLTTGPADDGLPPAPPSTDTSVAAMAAAAVLTETRPQDAARTLGAAAGSATEAPSLGAGALADVAGGALTDAPGAAAVPTEKLVGADAGIPPGRFSATGAFGGVPELSDVGAAAARHRLLSLELALAQQPVTGGKLAVERPANVAELDDYKALGFDFEVTSRQLNFRRAGVVHPITPTLRRTQDFTSGELELLRSEPLLVVRVL